MLGGRLRSPGLAGSCAMPCDPVVWQWLCELSARIRSSRVRYKRAKGKETVED